MDNISQEIQNNEIIYEELSDHYLNLRNRYSFIFFCKYKFIFINIIFSFDSIIS